MLVSTAAITIGQLRDTLSLATKTPKKTIGCGVHGVQHQRLLRQVATALREPFLQTLVSKWLQGIAHIRIPVIKTTKVFLPLLRNAAKTSLAKVITLGSPAGDIEFVVKAGFDFFAAYSLSKAAANMADWQVHTLVARIRMGGNGNGMG